MRASASRRWRRDLGQCLARPGAAHGVDMAMMPAPDPRANRRRVLEAEFGQRGDRVGIVLGAGENQIAVIPKRRRILEQMRNSAARRCARWTASPRRRRRTRRSPRTPRPPPIVRAHRAGAGSDDRRPFEDDVRPCAEDDRHSTIASAVGGGEVPGLVSAANPSSVPGDAQLGSRPPRISCWVCAKNSISRMPPRPSLTSWPATASRGRPSGRRSGA